MTDPNATEAEMQLMKSWHPMRARMQQKTQKSFTFLEMRFHTL